MKKLIALSAVLFAVVLTSNVFAQATSSTASASATAKIMTPIQITNVDGIVFGNVAAGSSVGTVVIAPDATGSRTSTGGVTPSAIGTFGSAEYSISGEANSTFTIALPASTTISNGTQSMTVNNFTSSLGATSTLSAGGAQTLYVGATLNVAATQATGTYSGTYNVTVAYN